jgi:hypothetical protein
MASRTAPFATGNVPSGVLTSASPGRLILSVPTSTLGFERVEDWVLLDRPLRFLAAMANLLCKKAATLRPRLGLTICVRS